MAAAVAAARAASRQNASKDPAEADESAQEATYWEGIRRLRSQDYEGAVECLEAAWKHCIAEATQLAAVRAAEVLSPRGPKTISLEDAELSSEGRGSAERGSRRSSVERSSLGGSLRGSHTPAVEDDLEVPIDFGDDAVVGGLRSRAASKRPGADAAEAARRESLQQPAPELSERSAQLPLQLCLALAKMQKWEQIDKVAAQVLQIQFTRTDFQDNIPRFSGQGDEERWVCLMIRRGVACAFLGPEHFLRAQRYFAMAVRVQPRNRNASRGLQCLRFLAEQLGPIAFTPTSSPCASALAALATA